MNKEKTCTDTTIDTVIDKWNSVCKALAEFTKQQDMATFDKCFKAMFDIMEFLGPYASFIKGMIIPDEVTTMLNEINEKLSELDKKLDKIVHEIKEEIKISEYNTYLNTMHNMQDNYNRFLNETNQVTLNDLNKQGENNKMLEFINWLHREVTGQSLNPLINFMKVDEDYPKFIKWTQLILTHYTEAMLLHSISVILRPNIETEILEKTLKYDIKQFNEKLEVMQEVFQTFIHCLIRGHFGRIGDKVISKVKTLGSRPKTSQDLTNIIYNFLNNQFPFREWFVLVVSGTHIKSDRKFWFNIKDDQALYLFEYRKNDKSHVFSDKEHENIRPFDFSYDKGTERGIFITSTLTDNSNYQNNVNFHLANISENIFRKYDAWFSDEETFSSNTGKVVLECLPSQYSSQVLCMGKFSRVDIGWKYSTRGKICFYERSYKYGLNSGKINIFTFKIDQLDQGCQKGVTFPH